MGENILKIFLRCHVEKFITKAGFQISLRALIGWKKKYLDLIGQFLTLWLIVNLFKDNGQNQQEIDFTNQNTVFVVFQYWLLIGWIFQRVLNWCIILFTIAISIYGLREIYDGPNILKAENHFAGGIDNSTGDFRIGFRSMV